MFKKNILTVFAFVCAIISHNSVCAANENELFIEDFKAKAGEQITLSVKMNNVAEITCFQFDLYLPNGVTIATEDGEDLIDLNQERTTYKKHTLSYMKQPDGAMRIVCNSGTNKIFSGNSGEVVTVVVNVSESIADGEYEISVKNQELTTPTLIAYNVEKTTCKMTVGSQQEALYGDVNGDGVVDVADITEVAKVILGIK